MNFKRKNKYLITAILTGKGGSKLKDKNIVKILGKPLLSYPCMAAKKVNEISNFFVSSENKKILDIAKKYGYEKIKRPSKFSRKNSLAFISSYIKRDMDFFHNTKLSKIYFKDYFLSDRYIVDFLSNYCSTPNCLYQYYYLGAM